MICGGHVLFEDVPGTAKTVLARAIAQTISRARRRRASSARPTCSRPTSPGSPSSTSGSGTSSSGRGRSSPTSSSSTRSTARMPKTQSALLEAMAEQQVTVDGQTRVLPDPFLLLATENPIEYEGTFPLPGGAARPLLPQDRARLPTDRRGDADRRGAASRSSASLARAGRRRGRRSARCAMRSHDRLRRSLAATLDRRARSRHAQPRRGGGRRFSARQPRARARRSCVGVARSSSVRRPRGHRSALRAGAACTVSCSVRRSSPRRAASAGTRPSKGSSASASQPRLGLSRAGRGAAGSGARAGRA